MENAPGKSKDFYENTWIIGIGGGGVGLGMSVHTARSGMRGATTVRRAGDGVQTGLPARLPAKVQFIDHGDPP